MNQVKGKSNTTEPNLICTIFTQTVAVNIVCLWHLILGACAAIPSTILYSLERGSEGLSMSLEKATLARKLSL